MKVAQGEETKRRTAPAWLAALAAYFLVVGAFLAPVIFRLGTAVMGRADAMQFLWGAWWMDQSLFQGRNPFFTDVLFVPVGSPLVFHSFAPLPSAGVALAAGLVSTEGARLVGRVAEPVPTQAVMATILDLVGRPVAPQPGQAPSLVGLFDPSRDKPALEPIVSSGLMYFENRVGLRFRDVKYVRYVESGKEVVFDLVADLEEVEPIPGTEWEGIEALRQEYALQLETASSVRRALEVVSKSSTERCASIRPEIKARNRSRSGPTARFRNDEIGPKRRAARPRGFSRPLLGLAP